MYFANAPLLFISSVFHLLLHCKYRFLIVFLTAFRPQRSRAVKQICYKPNCLLFLFSPGTCFNMPTFFSPKQINDLSVFKSFFQFHASSSWQLAFLPPLRACRDGWKNNKYFWMEGSYKRNVVLCLKAPDRNLKRITRWLMLVYF